MAPTGQTHAHRAGAAARAGSQGHLSEMFCSIQGEGLHLGERQIFLRTAGCTATCSWCDTVYSKMLTPRFVIHDDVAREKRTLDNPVALDSVIDHVRDFARRHHPVDTVSVTGGEPLEQPAFVRALAERLRGSLGLRVYLETNGVHAGPMAEVLPFVDVVAMDIKLPSAVGVELWDDHRAFLAALCAGGRVRPEAFVKIVMDHRSGLDEVGIAVDAIAAADPRIALVLQPESGTFLSPSTPRERVRALLDSMERAQRLALESLETVRVIPQLHKVIRVR